MTTGPHTVRALAEAYWAAEARRDLDAILSLYHDDADYQDAGGRVVGIVALRTWYERSARDYPRLHVEILREFPASDGAGAAFEFHADLWDAAGQHVVIRGVNVFLVKDGRFTSVRSYEDPPAPDTA